LTNISVQGTGFVPETLHVEISSYSHFHFQKSPQAEQRFRLRLRVEQIKPQFKNVNFSYQKKSFPSLNDYGVADVLFEGDGLSADVAITFNIEAGQISRAILTTCDVNLDSISLNIDIAKHDILDTLLLPLFQANLRRRFRSVVHEFIHTRLHQLIDLLNDWFLTKPFETMMVRGNETLHDVVKEMEKKQREMEVQQMEAQQKEQEGRQKESQHKESHQKQQKEVQQKETFEQKEEQHAQPST